MTPIGCHVARVTCAMAFAVAAVSAGTASAKPPNVIVLLGDDLGYADLGFQGCEDIPTPHLDALATAGVRFTDGYATCPVCSPTRAGLLTGRYQNRFGYEFIGGGFKPNPNIGLPPSETTVGDLLQDAGYVTGAIGKWHLGQEPQFRPWTRGFDEFYGFLGGGRSYFPAKDRPPVPFARYDPILRNGVEVDEPEYLTDDFGREAAEFVVRYKEEPFFLFVAFNAPHVPLQAPEDRLQQFSSIPHKGRRTYAAMVSAMDDAVGRLMQAIGEHGLRENTLVFFASDNGGHPLANAARNAPLRGQKGTVYEGGIRVPFLMSWPARFKAGSVYSRPIATIDILPTVLGAAGVEPPADLALDGVDLLPFLTGQQPGDPHSAIYWKYGDNRAVRQGDWKLTMPADGPAGLYDLSQDVGETSDLAASQPDKLRELTQLFDAWNDGLPAAGWPPSFMEGSAKRKAEPKQGQGE